MEAIDCKVGFSKNLSEKTWSLTRFDLSPDHLLSHQMNYEMRVEEHSNPLVVFMDQMIPHHENAVNMAR